MERSNYKLLKIIIAAAILLDLAVWLVVSGPLSHGGYDFFEIRFFDVGEGDASLITLPGGVNILIDAGPPNGRSLGALDNALGPGNRYIDLIIISHPQQDHIGGLFEIIKNYKIGAFISAGYPGEKSPQWQVFKDLLKNKKIVHIELAAGDGITYGKNHFSIISPRKSEWAKDLNDLCLVLIFESNGIKTFFGGDIGGKKERELAANYDIDADILKISHHGSKNSSDWAFLKEVSPLISVIGVGPNSYHHPAVETLERLKNSAGKLYRTDLDGIVKVILDRGVLRAYTEK